MGALNSEEPKSFLSQVEDTEKDKKYSIPAKRLLEKLEPIPSKTESLKNRWFWELIQNACDFNSEVCVEVELTSSQLTFRHNGKPFKIVDVENLITPDSDKDNDESTDENIGRFGSGFISTHVISSHITVDGIVQDNYADHYHFKLDLDRSEYQSKPKLIESIERSEQQFKTNFCIDQHIPGRFETSFTYDLNKGLADIDPKNVVESGLEFAFEILPYVLTFLPKLKSVKIVDKIKASTKYIYTKDLNTEVGKTTIGYKLNEIDQKDIHVRFESENDVLIAVIVDENGVKEYDDSYAKLFLSLPLIGTDRFPFPVPINSSKFTPETERNGINLSSHDVSNREVLVSGLAAYQKLLRKLSVDKVNGIYHLVKLKSERIKALSADSDWYQQNIEKGFKHIFEEIDLVYCNGQLVSYKQLKMPFIPENKSEEKDLTFYDTVYDLILKTTPTRNEYLMWLKNIDFTIFKNIPFRLSDAVKLVEETLSMEGLSKHLQKDWHQTEVWLTKFIKYVVVNDTGLLTNHRIIPSKSESGFFVNRDAEIYVDKDIDTDLIGVFNKMKNCNYNDKLLNDYIAQEISNLLPENKVKNQWIIAKEIDDIFRQKLEGNTRLTNDELEGLNLLLQWLRAKGFPHWSELSHYFPTFHSSYSNFFMESFNEEERLKAISIRNSGKQDALAKLANSNITESQLNRVHESIADVSKIIDVIDTGANIDDLAAFAKLFPEGIPNNVFQFAEEEAKNKKEFNNLLVVGSKVECLLIETLTGLVPTSNKEEIIHAGGGPYDIRIFNPTTKKSFYIEVKSCRNQNTDPINIAISQAKIAVKELPNENFAIVIIERTANNEMDTDYIKSNVQYLKNPGNYLGQIVDDYNMIESKANTSEKVDLYMDAEFKCTIDYKWVKEKIEGRGYNELIEDIRKILS